MPLSPIDKKLDELQKAKSQVAYLRNEADKATKFLDNIDYAVAHASQNATIHLQYMAPDPHDVGEFFTCQADMPMNQESADAVKRIITEHRDRLLNKADAIEAKYTD